MRGIGEKFTTNPATGTASLRVPLAVSPGRAGAALDLALAYDSGAGNGPFGIGWHLSLPQITRKTDRGLPRYGEDDVYVLSGAEDLVPAGDRARTVGGVAYRVRRYRPRVEAAFARIERWTAPDGDVHWRALGRDNVLNIYGRAGGRIADPEDPSRVFAWLIEETRDDRGNVCCYSYKQEAAGGAPARGPIAQAYPKRIQYGNRTPVLDRDAPAPTGDDDYLLEVVFDYGEHAAPATFDAGTAPEPVELRAWPLRADAFSTYRAGFELRTQRLCRRVLMMHRFAELGPSPCLVRSTDFTYDETPTVAYLASVTQAGYARRAAGGYDRATLPPLELGYGRAELRDELRALDRGSLVGIPHGVDGTTARWVDLDGEGLPGVLIAAQRAWFYQANLGGGRLAPPVEQRPLPVPAELGPAQLVDLGSDGNLDLVRFAPPLAGYFERTAERGWQPFVALPAAPALDPRDPQLRVLDVDGDGLPDLVVSEHDAFVWYRSRGAQGFERAAVAQKPRDERVGAAVVFADGTGSIHLADMTGDGLLDIVRVRSGEVCYWPNLGYGRFGRRVTMAASPGLDTAAAFDPQRARFADLDGSGTADLLYLGRDGVWIYANQAGNGFAAGVRLASAPRIDSARAAEVIDLLGRGTPCLVVSDPSGAAPVVYVELLARKPHLLERVANNLGAETHLAYAPSTQFYLADQRAGQPWITRLAFPVHVIERVEVVERITGNRMVTRFAYHHGYFDGEERELRGFGLVEQWDAESLPALGGAASVPPVRTRTWFHTGAYLGRERISRLDAAAYWREPGASDADAAARLLPDTVLPAGLSPAEEREACRALRGTQLRQEVFADDDLARPYSVTEQTFGVRCLQRRGANAHAVFHVHVRESLTYHHERAPADPRLLHALTLDVDDFGNVLAAAAIAYGRRAADPVLPLASDRDAQAGTLATYTERVVTAAVDDDGGYRTPLPAETRTYELTNFTPSGPGGRFTADDLAGGGARLVFDHEVGYEDAASALGATRARRLVEHARTLYRRDDLTALLPLRALDSRALPGETYKLAFTAPLLAAVYSDRVTPAMLVEAGYVAEDGVGWWLPAGRAFVSPDPADSPAGELAYARAHFFLPVRARDPFGAESTVAYDAYDLLPVGARDAIGNEVRAENDYRVLAPARTSDPNGNATAVAFDLRGLVAGTAAMGKHGEGDSLAGFVADLPDDVARAHLADPRADPLAVLGGATSRIVYDAFAYVRTRDSAAPQPAVSYTAARIAHGAAATRVHHSLAYSDGLGRVIQHKVAADDGRWVGSGWTIYNNKGLATRRYEPFFAMTPAYEAALAAGVSPIAFHDPLGRVVATLYPDGSYDKVLVGPWRTDTWDRNDTVLLDPRTDPDVRALVAPTLTDPAWQTWHQRRATGALGAAEQLAARRAAAHAGTPGATHVDALGRTVLAIVDAGVDAAGAAVSLPARTEVDIEGNALAVRDAVAVPDARGRVIMQYAYDVAGRRVHSRSMEAGARWTLADARGQPCRTWDSRGHALRTEYDVLRRPVRGFARGITDGELLVERFVYGEQHPDAAANLRGALYLHLDQAGAVTDEAHDFRGNALRAGRRLARSFDRATDWTAVEAALASAPLDLAAIDAALAPLVEAEAFVSRTAYDALGRAIQVVPPHGAGTPVHVLQPAYTEANLLARVDVWLARAEDPLALLDPAAEPPAPVGVAALAYNARGQRVRIAYANGAETAHVYDPQTFRLAQLYTRRGAAFTDDCDNPQPPPATIAAPAAPPPGTACGLQNLAYTYDPVGNVVRIADSAQQAVYFRNRRVDASREYAYDAAYRLVEATGREHLGQVGAPAPSSADDAPRVGLPHPSDGNALGRYVERYAYDAASNLRALHHVGLDPASPGWTREFRHAEASQLDATAASNRLTSARVGDTTEVFSAAGDGYDAHGNSLRAPHLRALQWDHRDQLQMTQRQAAASGDAERTWYVYDAAGVRRRKVTVSAAGQLRRERLYLGGVELERIHTGAGLARETLHVMDDQRRIALVERRTAGAEPGQPATGIRYQLANHLGSAVLELDEAAQIIAYEEYTPYGSTAYQATDVPRRYRHAGRERDDESGFYAYERRYYAPWLARWVSADPAGIADAANTYLFVRANPVRYHDRDGRETGEVADQWQAAQERAVDPDGNPVPVGEHIAGAVSDVTTAVGDFVAGHLPTGDGIAATAVRGGVNGLLAAGKAIIDSAGGLAATIADPSSMMRGFLRMPRLWAEGTKDVAEGRAADGHAKQAQVVLTGVTMALGAAKALVGPKAPINPGGRGGIKSPAMRDFATRYEQAAADSMKGGLTDVAQQLEVQPMMEAPAGEIGPQLLPARIAKVGNRWQLTSQGGQPLIFRIDAVIRNKLTGRLTWEEAKSTSSAPLTRNQGLGFPLFERIGGIAADTAGEVGIAAGDALGPQRISLVRGDALTLRLQRPLVEAMAGTAMGLQQRGGSP